MDNEDYKNIPNEVKECFQTTDFSEIMDFYWGQKFLNRNINAKQFSTTVKKWFSRASSEEMMKSWLFHCFEIEWTEEVSKNPVVQIALSVQKEFEMKALHTAN